MTKESDEAQRRDFSAEYQNRIVRLLAVVGRLQGGESFKAAELANDFGVNRRTIGLDMNVLRGMGVPVTYSQREGKYIVTGPLPFRLLDITPKEAAALALTDAAAQVARGMGWQDAFTSALEKVRRLVPPDTSDALDEIQSAVLFHDATMRDYSNAPLDALMRACHRRQTILVDYDSRSSGRRERRLEPYTVIFRHGFWLLLARDPERDEVRSFALDRMVHKRTMPDETFQLPDGWSAEAFMAGSVSVMHGEMVDITLRFTPDSPSYLYNRKWGFPHTLKGPEPDGAFVLEGKVAGLEEIMREALRWGRYVTVLAPKELRDRVAEEARIVAEKYI